jgi:hypothetical protein
VHRPRQELLSRQHVHDLGCAAYHDPVAGVGHDGQIVGHEQQAETWLGVQATKHARHLSLEADVQGRSRLIGDQEQRLVRDRHRDDQPLVSSQSK